MLNLFSSSQSVSCQFLVLDSSLFQVIFMKNHSKNPLFEGLCYNLKGLELLSKMNFESSWVSEGLKICKTMYFLLSFWFSFMSLPLSGHNKQFSRWLQVFIQRLWSSKVSWQMCIQIQIIFQFKSSKDSRRISSHKISA